uniref:Zinc finger GRF-type domain-containing protein n=1 Tax=Oryza glumipatula TaxID=40148 RepID=A0A0D9Y2R7_9ORYZ
MEASYTSGVGRSAISRRCRVPSVAPSIPELKCACGHAATVQTSNTPRNPRRRWLQCPGEMVAYCHAGEYDYLRETCDSLRQFIADQRHHISQLSA